MTDKDCTSLLPCDPKELDGPIWLMEGKESENNNLAGTV